MARILHRSSFVGLSIIGTIVSLTTIPSHGELSFVPLPKSQNLDRVRSNIDVFDFEMSREDVQRLDELDCGKDGAVTWNPIDAD
jgi:diketogulonate reductase-like aldo/keto reductase